MSDGIAIVGRLPVAPPSLTSLNAAAMRPISAPRYMAVVAMSLCSRASWMSWMGTPCRDSQVAYVALRRWGVIFGSPAALQAA